MPPSISIHWFRRDLRLNDNAALYHALRSGLPVLPIFIFDITILNELEDRADKRVQFIHLEIEKLHNQLQEFGSILKVFYGNPLEIWKTILMDYKVEQVFTNHDYEPYAEQRDSEIKRLLNENNISFQTFKDQVIFEKNEVMKDDGKPYTIFTPYSRKWKAKLNDFYFKSFPTENYFSNFIKTKPAEIISLAEMNFKKSIDFNFPSAAPDLQIIKSYNTTRDFPAVNGTTKLSVHLRFGTISIRQLASIAKANNEIYLNELIWREFYQMILWHFPKVIHQSFKSEYDKISWRNNETEFEKWCNGETGYPIVDAGMRELNETGFMHNRVRMVVASFLTKHLLIDWRWGEAYFANKLLDFELASNNGGWQWAAGSGCDAAPYFRVFNPILQTEKFDRDLLYIKKWVPEFQELTYFKPIVEHTFARERVLKVYKEALKG